MLAPAPWTIATLPTADVALDDAAPLHDTSAGGQRRVTVDRLLGLGLHAVCQGRLTTESGVPVSVADRTAQGTLYFTPYHGNRLGLYDGTRWRLFTFGELSLALDAMIPGRNYDVYVTAGAGGVLSLSLNPWTNDITRAVPLALQDGVPVASSASPARYLGTLRATAATTTEDSKARRFVWNLYHRRPRPLYVREFLGGVTYNGGWRYFNNNGANRVEFVVGQAEEPVAVSVTGELYGGGGDGYVTWFPNAGTSGTTPAVRAGAGTTLQASAFGAYMPTAGYHFLALTQFSNSATARFDAGQLDGMVMG